MKACATKEKVATGKTKQGKTIRRKKYVASDEVRAMRRDVADMEDEPAIFDKDLSDKVESGDNEKVRNEVGPAFRGILGLMSGLVSSCKALQQGVEHVDKMMFDLCGGDDDDSVEED